MHILADGRARQPHLQRDGCEREPCLIEGDDLLKARETSRTTDCSPSGGGCVSGGRWLAALLHIALVVGLGSAGLAWDLCRRFRCGRRADESCMACEHALKHGARVAGEMEAIRDLKGLWHSLAS